MSCGARASNRADALTMRSVRKPLVGKCRTASRRHAGDDGVEDLSMSFRRKISPPVRSTQVMPGSVDEREHFVGGQLVGRLALPDVAGLAAVLAPVGEAQIDLERTR